MGNASLGVLVALSAFLGTFALLQLVKCAWPSVKEAGLTLVFGPKTEDDADKVESDDDSDGSSRSSGSGRSSKGRGGSESSGEEEEEGGKRKAFKTPLQGARTRVVGGREGREQQNQRRLQQQQRRNDSGVELSPSSSLVGNATNRNSSSNRNSNRNNSSSSHSNKINGRNTPGAVAVLSHEELRESTASTNFV